MNNLSIEDNGTQDGPNGNEGDEIDGRMHSSINSSQTCLDLPHPNVKYLTYFKYKF